MVRTVLTEIGLVPYWHIQGPEYEILLPGNKGTDRVFNKNPEGAIQQLAARIGKGPKDKFEKMKRRIELLGEEIADLKLNSVRQPEPEKLFELYLCNL